MIGRREDKKPLNLRPNAALSRDIIMRHEDDETEPMHSTNEEEKLPDNLKLL